MHFPPVAHALALAGALGEVVFRTIKMKLSSNALRFPISYLTSLRVCLAGDFGSAITPSRSGGEPARFLVLSEARVPATKSIVLLYSELLLEVLTLAILTLFFAALFHDAGAALAAVSGIVGMYATLVVGLGLFGFLLARRSSSGPMPRWTRFLGFNAIRWRAVQRGLRKIQSGVAVVRDIRWGMGALALFFSILHVASRLVVLPALVLFVDPSAPLGPLVLWPLAIILGAVVSPAPAGGGVVEVGFAAVLAGAIAAPVMGSALLWWRFYTFYLLVILGALATGGTVMRALRSSERGGDEVEVVAPFDDAPRSKVMGA